MSFAKDQLYRELLDKNLSTLTDWDIKYLKLLQDDPDLNDDQRRTISNIRQRIRSIVIHDLGLANTDIGIEQRQQLQELKTFFQIKYGTSREEKIPTIKKVREILGIGLKEAKDIVDRWGSEVV